MKEGYLSMRKGSNSSRQGPVEDCPFHWYSEVYERCPAGHPPPRRPPPRPVLPSLRETHCILKAPLEGWSRAPDTCYCGVKTCPRARDWVLTGTAAGGMGGCQVGEGGKGMAGTVASLSGSGSVHTSSPAFADL